VDKKTLSIFVGMGFELTALIAVGGFTGEYFERHYNCGGMAILAGCMLALVAWLIHFFILLQKIQKQSDPS
jgi:hypothetical protein